MGHPIEPDTVSRSDAVSMKRKVVAIVDPYGSGKYLIEELQRQGWDLIGIQSTLRLASFWLKQFNPSIFVKSILAENDAKFAVKELRDFDVAACIAGSEPGVDLADEIQELLGLPANGSATKDWRRHKYAMQERLREVGLRAVNQILASDADEVINWVRNVREYPIVVKPPRSGGTDGVYICKNDTHVRKAFEKEFRKINVNGAFNDKLLAQEFLEGTEYIIDCTSYEGRHVLCGIHEYRKVNTGSDIYVCNSFLIDSRGEIQEQLISYVFQVLTALGIRYGASHTEVMMCADGPCLVETGARMQGLKGPKMTEDATGFGLHELLVDVAVNSGYIHQQLYKQNYRYILKKQCAISFYVNLFRKGVLKKQIDVALMKKLLPTVVDIFPNVQVGEEVPITRDIASHLGINFHISQSLKNIADDIAKLRKMEQDPGFFQVESVSRNQEILKKCDIEQEEEIRNQSTIAVSPQEGGGGEGDDLC